MLLWPGRARLSRGRTQAMHGGAAQVCGLKWAPDDRLLASGGNDNMVGCWSANSPNPVHRFDSHTVRRFSRCTCNCARRFWLPAAAQAPVAPSMVFNSSCPLKRWSAMPLGGRAAQGVKGGVGRGGRRQ